MGLHRRFRPERPLRSGGPAGADFDAKRLRALAADDPSSPRWWAHYLEFDDEFRAMAAAAAVPPHWRLLSIRPTDEQDGWEVSVMQDHVVITAELVRQARRQLQAWAHQLPGSTYTGWRFGPARVPVRLVS